MALSVKVHMSLEGLRASTWKAVLAGLASGVLLALAMPPLQLGWLAWIALVPLLLATYHQKRIQTYLITLVWSAATIIGYSDAYFWQRSPIFVVIIVMGVLGQTIVVAEIQLLARRFNQWLLIPCLWTGALFVIGRLLFLLATPLPPNLPLVSIANTQWLSPVFLQILSIAGEPGLVFVLLLANTGLAEALHRFGVSRRWWLPLVIVLVAVCATGLWGVSQLNTPESSQTIGVVVVPGTMPSSETRSMVQAANAQPITLPDGSRLPPMSLVVWAESPVGTLTDAARVAEVGALAQELKLYLVADFNAPQADGRHQNVAVIFGPDGTLLSRNAKKLIPLFEESVPGDPAAPPAIITTPWGRMTSLICYETLFPAQVREVIQRGVDLLVVPSNPMGFTPRADAIHLSQTIFRAVENHVSIAFSANDGVSALVDSRGQVLIHSPFVSLIDSGAVRSTMASLSALPIVAGSATLYSRIGDAFALGLILLSMGWLSVCWRRPRLKS